MSLGLILFIVALLTFVGLAVYYRKSIVWYFKKHNITWKKFLIITTAAMIGTAGLAAFLPVGDEPEPIPEPYFYEEFIAPANSFGMGNTTFKTVNWSYFKQLFNAHTDWLLEYKRYSYSDWTDGNQYMTIEKSWNENLSGWKFNLILDVPVGVYSARFTFGCDLVVLDYVERDGWQVNLNYTIPGTDEVYNVFFNWSDMANIPGVIFTHGKTNDIFWFRFRRDGIPAGHYEFDPTFGAEDETTTSIITIEDSANGGGLFAFPGTTGDTLTSISAYVSETVSGTPGVRGAIYSWDDARALVAVSDETAISGSSAHWETFTFPSPPSLTNDEDYFFVVASDSETGNVYFYYGTGGTDTVVYADAMTYPIFDTPSGASFYGNYKVGIYGTYAPSNTAPTQSGESPSNTSTGISVTPDLYVICLDDDADNMNVTWWSNSSDSWVQFASNGTIANNTNITQSFTNATLYSTKYWWSVNLTDDNGGWNNETYHFTTLDATIYNTTIRNDGIDYFVWLGANTTASVVDDDITGFDELAEYMSIWRNGTWGGSAIGNWVTYYGDESGTDFSIYTYDVVKIYLTDSSTQLIEMTSNADITYSNSRTVTLLNDSVTLGGNYTGYTNTTSTTLSSLATAMGLDSGEYLNLWNETTFTWNFYIVGFYEPVVAVHEDDVIFTKVEDTESWAIAGK